MSLFAEAKKYIAGGVNSPVRAFAAVGGEPLFFKSGRGAWLSTEDGRRMIDYVGSWGPMILGHAHPDVVNAVTQAAESGLSFGAPTVAETALAKKICEFMPSIEPSNEIARCSKICANDQLPRVVTCWLAKCSASTSRSS